MNSIKSIMSMFIYDIIRKYGTRSHPISFSEICDLVKKEYKVKVDPKTVRRHLEVLSDPDEVLCIVNIDRDKYYYDKGLFANLDPALYRALYGAET